MVDAQIHYPLDKEGRWVEWHVDPARLEDALWQRWFDIFGLARSVYVDAEHGIIELDGQVYALGGPHSSPSLEPPDDFVECVHRFRGTPTVHDLLDAATRPSVDRAERVGKARAHQHQEALRWIERRGTRKLRDAAKRGVVDRLAFVKAFTKTGFFRLANVVDWDFQFLRPPTEDKMMRADQLKILAPFRVYGAVMVPRRPESRTSDPFDATVIASVDTPIAPGGWFLYAENITATFLRATGRISGFESEYPRRRRIRDPKPRGV